MQDFIDVVDERVYAEIQRRDVMYGVIVGTVPSIFLGVFTPLYCVAELILYAATKNKLWLYAAITSFIVSIAMILVYASSGYRDFLHREIEILPFKFS